MVLEKTEFNNRETSAREHIKDLFSKRVASVDTSGNYYTDTNPLPVRNFKHISGLFWDNEQTGVDTPSAIIDTENLPHISIYGELSTKTTFNVFVSDDGINFYLCEDLSTKINQPEGLTFHIFFTAGVRYFRLESNTDVIATAGIAAKP